MGELSGPLLFNPRPSHSWSGKDYGYMHSDLSGVAAPRGFSVGNSTCNGPISTPGRGKPARAPPARETALGSPIPLGISALRPIAGPACFFGFAAWGGQLRPSRVCATSTESAPGGGGSMGAGP